MSEKHGKRYTPHLKFQIVVEILKGEKTVGQLARSYNLHPISIHRWKKEFLEKGPERKPLLEGAQAEPDSQTSPRGGELDELGILAEQDR